jgi:type I restriction enzyme R subunit
MAEVHVANEGTADDPRLFIPYNDGILVQKYKINLPHWRQDGRTYFITWRLADALPQQKLKILDAERQTWFEVHGIETREEVEYLPEAKRQEYHRRFTAILHEWLDAGYGSCALRNPACAEIVESSLRHFDGKRYVLDDFVVMPNHVHFLVKPLPGFSLSELQKSWKGFTSREINKVLGRTGTFWQKESWDHIVRSGAQLEHYRRYVAENPVKAKLRKGEYVLGSGTGLIVAKEEGR